MASVNGSKGNHRLYREVNKRIREVTEAWGANGPVEFVCECGRDDCTTTIRLTYVQYQALSNGGDTVLLVPDHMDALDGHRVVAENGRFVVVASD